MEIKRFDRHLREKVCINKSVILSTIGYEIEMRGIPLTYEKKINTIIRSFVCDGKPFLVPREVCCLPKEKGGINMVNLRYFIKSKQVKML